MPKFDWLFLSRLAEVGAAFRTDEHIAYVNAPVLILHALNDCMVPFELGQKVRGEEGKGLCWRGDGEERDE